MDLETTNKDIRLEILGSGLKYWQVANALGISNSTLSVRLHREFSDNEKGEIRQIITLLTRRDTVEQNE